MCPEVDPEPLFVVLVVGKARYNVIKKIIFDFSLFRQIFQLTNFKYIYVIDIIINIFNKIKLHWQVKIVNFLSIYWGDVI